MVFSQHDQRYVCHHRWFDFIGKTPIYTGGLNYIDQNAKFAPIVRTQAFGGETTAQTNGTRYSIEWQKKNNSVKFEADNHGDISLKYERKF